MGKPNSIESAPTAAYQPSTKFRTRSGTTAGYACPGGLCSRGQAKDLLLLLFPLGPRARQPSPAQFPVLIYEQCHCFFGPISAGSRIPGRLLAPIRPGV